MKFATITLIKEVEDWQNSVKPSMLTTGSIILWEVFKVEFLENYVPRDLKQRKTKGEQELEKFERVQKNKKKDERKNQKPYARSQATSGKFQYRSTNRGKKCH